ncbi:MAG: SUF system NifU family Fe-S cluster assembly protein [Dehalococcoidia bacterium]|nr:SUF system NifU family Fe-S cluster assembly protein [Dehalococcoidia bacterium]MCB9484883.1 SUF system NifU family Fe-S cluster assembly protein [Thermoflexaceae bacterium]
MTTGASLEELYREVILDHFRDPRNKGTLPNPTGTFSGSNPVCGDEVTIDLVVEEGRIVDVAFRGEGCSISQASSSMLAERVVGMPADDSRKLAAAVRTMLQTGDEPVDDVGDLDALRGVAKFPVRVKCALLSWNVLEQGLNELAPAS